MTDAVTTTGRFKMKVSGDAPVMIQMSGPITEMAHLDPAGIPAADLIVIDVGEVPTINSLGVRDWMRFVAGLRARSVEIHRLGPLFVLHASTIRDFLGRARVVSAIYPWECPSCGHYTDQVMKLPVRLAPLSCPKCGAEMVLDSLPGVYDHLTRVEEV